MLEKDIWENGKLNNIRCDNGPEFISIGFPKRCEANGIKIIHIQFETSTHNSYVELFNGSYWCRALDAYIFRTLDEIWHKLKIG